MCLERLEAAVVGKLKEIPSHIINSTRLTASSMRVLLQCSSSSEKKQVEKFRGYYEQMKEEVEAEWGKGR